MYLAATFLIDLLMINFTFDYRNVSDNFFFKEVKLNESNGKFH